jgi:hypothetical protein
MRGKEVLEEAGSLIAHQPDAASFQSLVSIWDRRRRSLSTNGQLIVLIRAIRVIEAIIPRMQ